MNWKLELEIALSRSLQTWSNAVAGAESVAHFLIFLWQILQPNRCSCTPPTPVTPPIVHRQHPPAANPGARRGPALGEVLRLALGRAGRDALRGPGAVEQWPRGVVAGGRRTGQKGCGGMALEVRILEE